MRTDKEACVKGGVGWVFIVKNMLRNLYTHLHKRDLQVTGKRFLAINMLRNLPTYTRGAFR